MISRYREFEFSNDNAPVFVLLEIERSKSRMLKHERIQVRFEVEVNPF